MVSVIIPIYNAEKYLYDCLFSIECQTYHDFEVICVNDGSTDESLSVCELFSSKDNRFAVISQSNKGVSAARNVGIDRSVGDYICFIDADDKLDSLYLECLINNMKNRDLAICDYTRTEFELGKGGEKKLLISSKALVKSIVFESIKHPNIVCFLYKSSIIKNHHLRFTEGCVKNEDTEFYLKYITYCKLDIAMIDYKGYYYRENNLSVSLIPISFKSLTSIEASRRIGLFLEKCGYLTDGSLELSNSVLSYTYFLARERNIVLYDYLHEKYDVRESMNKMLNFPRIKKKLVAIAYLTLGRSYFFYLLSRFK